MALPPPSETTVALVTGASSGIGEAIARELAGRGHSLALTARREDRLRQLAAELAERHGVRSEVVRADLGEPAGRDALEAHLEQAGKEVGVLVNNAGFGDAGNFADADRERLLAMVRLNCVALTDLQARYLPAMVERGSGAVINIASTAVLPADPRQRYLRGDQGLRPQPQRGDPRRARRHRGDADRRLPRARAHRVPRRGRHRRRPSRRTPDIVWMSAEAVAKAAVDGAENGKRVVVPGLLNRAGALSGQHAPRALILPLAKRIWRQAF